MNLYVADTHALYWYRTGSPKLGSAAKRAFDEGARGEAIILVPAIVLAELYFLNEKAGSPLNFRAELDRWREAAQFVFVAFDADHVTDFDADAAVTEMHDRIIVGVARRLNAFLITRDKSMSENAEVDVTW